jgi:nicotinate dehydrogenase subunit B
MTAVLPAILADNPRLDCWVGFTTPGKVAISTGRVEFGQGVLTAMAQLAAEELDVAVGRIAIRSGDTDGAPNEGYTAGSQSMQAGGVALRQVCAEAKALFLARAASSLGCAAAELTVRDGRVLRNGTPTPHDYWSLAATVTLATDATGAAVRKAAADYAIVGRNAPRLDLPAKIFGQPIFIHDMVLDGMAHARVVRQPNRGAMLTSIDEAALRRIARVPVEFVRDGNFVAIVGDDETAVEAAAAAASDHVVWRSAELPRALQQEAAWLLQCPSVDRVIGALGSRSRRHAGGKSLKRAFRALISLTPRSDRPAALRSTATGI